MPNVSYSLSVDGRSVDPELLARVREVEVEEHAEMADILRLRLAVAVQESGSSWTALDESLFERLTNVRVQATIGDNSESLIDAYVIETRAEFSDQPGGSQLEVVAMDGSVLLNLEEKVRAWPDMSDSDIADAIFGEHGLTPQVESTRPTRLELDRTVLQRGTDIQFLRELARRNGYECVVELDPRSGEAQGCFRPPRVDEQPQGVLSVNLGSATNVNRFQARYDMLRPTTAQATGLEVGGQSDQSGEAEQGALTDLGGTALSATDRPRRALLSNTGLADSAELQTYAQAVVDRSSWAIRAEGELSTVAYGGILHAKRPVNVRGAGRQFSGTYYVERVLHRITGEGYTQYFTLRRNARSLTGQESFTEDRALAS